MAESLTVRQAESVRLMIDASKLVNRLQASIHENEQGQVKELSATQVQAAKILLDKALPSLQSADITAHSSPQIESEEVLLATLQALIAKHPHLISHLQANAPAIPAHIPTTDPLDDGGNSGGNTYEAGKT